MAVGIREFSTPNYAQHIPGEEKEERPIQKIEKFATFLNELPWFPKGFFDGEDETEATADMLVRNSSAGVTGDDVKSAVDKSITENKDMADIAKADANRGTFGLTPDMAVELQVMQDAAEFAKALEAAEGMRQTADGKKTGD